MELFLDMFFSKNETVSTPNEIQNPEKMVCLHKSAILSQSWGGFSDTLLQHIHTACGIVTFKPKGLDEYYN